MEMVKITINGQAVDTIAGSTILQAASKAGIQIPTLCNHPALPPTGACRVCLVEVKGQRNLQPACAFPVMDGMEVETETPALVRMRKFILDMLFSERNHYCMYCEASGSCELQNLGYRYGVDHWVYPTYTKGFPTDATNPYFLIDHNRCVLCGRCIRACAELPANHTLGLGQRGAHSMVRADAQVPQRSSTCISCGSCVEVCPTGAIVGKLSAFMGRDDQMTYTKSTCSRCSVGCGMTIVTRGGSVQRIESDWEAPVNEGRLCQKGRFEPLYETRHRLSGPMVRRNGRLQPASWDEALQAAAQRVEATDAGSIAVFSSSGATNEALYLFDRLFRKDLKVATAALLNRVVPGLPGGSPGLLAEIGASDFILVIGADPVKNQPVASFFIKRAFDGGARVIVVDDADNGLSPFAWQTLPLAELDSALNMAERADRPVILCGEYLPDDAADSLQRLPKKVPIIVLEPGCNTFAAKSLGFVNGLPASTASLLFVLLGEECAQENVLLADMDEKTFVVVQAAYASSLSERADVVLPTAIWSERDGTLVNTEGRVFKANGAVAPFGEAKPDWEVLALLADKLGRKFGASFDEISAHAVREITGKEMQP